MEPRRGDKVAWVVALVAAAIVVIVVLMNGDELEGAFSGDHGGAADHGASPTSGDGGRQQEVR
jgi:hypothetical protein